VLRAAPGLAWPGLDVVPLNAIFNAPRPSWRVPPFGSATPHTQPAPAAAAAQVVTVLGMHRSGTSLCAQVLQALGVDMAEDPGISPHNLSGHWERPRINDLNDRVFARFDRAWHEASHVLALPEAWLQDAQVQAVRHELGTVIRQGLRRSARFGFKDPRTARLLPLWAQVFEDLGAAPRFVFCLRDPAQVARSVRGRDGMAQEQAEYRWLLYNAGAIAGMGGAPFCLVPYEDWFARPAETLRRLAAFIGVPEPNPAVLDALVDPRLRHDEAAPPARPLARRLHALILRDAAAARAGADLRALCAGLEEFEQQVQPLLVDREVLRASVAEQNRVIGDLNALIRALRLAAV
jgi:hypothetical protein